jgi:hypothetical protein
MGRADGTSVRRLHDRGGEPGLERGCENGALREDRDASQEGGRGRDVESPKEHGRSLWPTAKRFSPLGLLRAIMRPVGLYGVTPLADAGLKGSL